MIHCSVCLKTKQIVLIDLVSHLSQDDYNARFQLDRIDVYVTREAFIDNIRLEESRCSYLTRNSQTIRSSRLHLQCPTPTLGRFIHLRLFAVRMAFNRTEQRFALPFKAYFCEIYAYNWSKYSSWIRLRCRESIDIMFFFLLFASSFTSHFNGKDEFFTFVIRLCWRQFNKINIILLKTFSNI